MEYVMKNILIVFLFTLSFNYINAQEISENYKNSFRENYGEGIKYYFQGNIKLSKVYFQTELSSKPDDINTLKYLAEISIAEHDLLKTQYYYEKILNVNSNDEDALISLGVIYLNNGNIERAKGFLLEATKNQPDNELALYNLAVLYGTTGEFTSAVRMLEQLI